MVKSSFIFFRLWFIAVGARLLALGALVSFSSFAFAQNIEMENVEQYLSKYDLSINWPTERKVKIRKLKKKPFSPEGISLYYPSEKIQIIINIDKSPASEVSFPNLKNGTRLSHYAGNEEDSIISLHALGDKELAQLNAEWGTQAFFRPKIEFTDNHYCQLISFYAENKAQVFVYYLFEDTENPLLQRSFDLINYIRQYDQR